MINRQRLLFLWLAIATIVGGSLFAYLYFHSSFAARSEAACLGQPKKVSFTVHPTFYLNKKFLETDTLSEETLLSYAQTHLRFVHLGVPAFQAGELPKFATLPFDGIRIRKIRQTDATYPLTLRVQDKGISPYFIQKLKSLKEIDAAYMVKALDRGETTLQDSALKVSYTADLEMMLCEDQKNHFADRLNLPLDPLLAFWFVPFERRVERFNDVFQEKRQITPCASADFLYDHDPYYYWHYWSLHENQCRESLPEGAIASFAVEEKKSFNLETAEPFDLQFLRDLGSRDLKITVNFTMIDDDSVFVPEPVGLELKEKIEAVIIQSDFAKAREAVNALSAYDIAIRTGLVFAWSMKNMSDHFEFKQLALADMLLQWQIKGQLKQSGKPYQILVTVGSAMQEMPSYTLFYSALNQGLASSDIIYFGGHSGVGKNLSENRILEQVKNLYGSLPNDEVPSHQLVMLMTCYSLRYFPLSGFPLPQKPFTRDVLYTASVPSGYDARMLVGLLEQVDRYLDEKRHLNFEKWPEFYKADVFLVHQRQSF